MDATGILLISGFVFVLVTLIAITLGPVFGWRIAAKHEAFITFQSHHIPRAKIREAFAEQGWQIIRDQPHDMEAHTRPNWRSWGELVSLRFRDGGADIRSVCSYAWQAVDYGKNRTNVQKLIETLKSKNA